MTFVGHAKAAKPEHAAGCTGGAGCDLPKAEDEGVMEGAQRLKKNPNRSLPSDPSERLLSVDDLADYLGVSSSRIYDWRYRGEAPR